MAKISSVDKISKFNTFDIEKLTRQEKIDLIASSSKTLYDRYKRLKASGLESPYLNRMVDVPKRYLKKTLNKMSNTELKNKLQTLSLRARNKTSSIKGVKQFYKKFKQTTGVEYNTIDSKTWEKIRQKIESDYHSSDEIIAAYASYDNEDDADAYLASLDDIDTTNEDLDDIEDLDDYIYD